MDRLDDKNNAICDQLKVQQEEIERLRTALKECQARCRNGQEASRQTENKHLLMIATLKKDLNDSHTVCELLKVKLNEQTNLNRQQSLELNDSKAALFETNEKWTKAKQEVIKSMKLEQDNERLLKNCLVLGEINDMYKQNLAELMTTKSSSYDYECLQASEADVSEIKSLKHTLDQKIVQLDFAQAKNKHLEEQLSQKESTVNQLKHTLETLKSVHKHECDALKGHMNSLKSICQMFEQRLLTSHPKDSTVDHL